MHDTMTEIHEPTPASSAQTQRCPLELLTAEEIKAAVKIVNTGIWMH
jgi:Cu2+-containing amine oxidase